MDIEASETAEGMEAEMEAALATGDPNIIYPLERLQRLKKIRLEHGRKAKALTDIDALEKLYHETQVKLEMGGYKTETAGGTKTAEGMEASMEAALASWDPDIIYQEQMRQEPIKIRLEHEGQIKALKAVSDTTAGTSEKNKTYNTINIHAGNNGQFNITTEGAAINATQNNGLNIHELKRNTAAPQAKLDAQIDTNKGGTMIFLSYSWKDETLADVIDERFQSSGINLTRDIRDVEYKQSMKEFMRKVRNSKFVVIILSKNYLKSSNCMYEILEFVKDPDYRKRIIPIIEKSANIFSPEGKVKYLQYWDNQIKKLNKDVKQLEPTDAIGIIEDLKHYKNISSSISEFLSIVSDMNNIVVDKTINDNDFNTILKYMSMSF